MQKVILTVFFSISLSAFAGGKFGMSPVAYTAVAVEDEKLTMLGTMITPRSGISFNFAYKTEYMLELGIDFTYAETSKIDDESTDSLEYELLQGSAYAGLNVGRFKPYVGMSSINLKYSNTDSDLTGRFDGTAPVFGAALNVHKKNKLNTEIDFNRTSFTDSELNRSVTVDVMRIMLSVDF
jgi:opacity protein-like surface antigen